MVENDRDAAVGVVKRLNVVTTEIAHRLCVGDDPVGGLDFVGTEPAFRRGKNEQRAGVLDKSSRMKPEISGAVDVGVIDDVSVVADLQRRVLFVEASGIFAVSELIETVDCR